MENKLTSLISSILYQNRLCDQENFDLLICGRHKKQEDCYVRNIYKASYPHFTKIETLESRSKFIYSDRLLTSGSSIWTISNHGYLNSNSISKCGHTNRLIQLPDIRGSYSACFYMKNIYVFGGFCKVNYKNISSCAKYDTNIKKWSYIASMNKCKESAACTVFEGKVVVLGGACINSLKLVESYDYYENKWTLLPDMIQDRCEFGAVSI